MTTTNHPPSTTKTAPHRLPAPALFVGPPSRNASNLSLARGAPGGRPVTSHAPESPHVRPTRPSASPPSSPTHNTASILELTRTTSSQVPLRPRPSKSSIEAQWSDLQRTLNEVETAAPGIGPGVWGGNATVFGAGHGKALEELRGAQIRLAEAWGPRGGEGEGQGHARKESKGKEAKGERKVSGKSGKSGRTEETEVWEDAESEAMGKGRRHRDGEQDLRTAAERREKNEEYFMKVKAGVQDVVGKLDEVSKAMRRVEGEGREIWEESSLESRERGSQKGAET
ncbi:1-phosphatidylinositol 4,5-bisphosphate phosphodiesterase 1 [Elsinoe australis]|uniref:1-phosphatidylinositol 4,5-bisphosphate phosphodiesterase 1 n=1 Tax=Elsinoe australis TaxID=40998 RepID=A0A2P7YEU2_9PEZI|nr:1-phosphatidylinositol 4,5-bisphosphate phosphodiesterase 1 [Elsinoe australis]